MKDIKNFRHEMFGEVRTMTNESREIYFVGKDVAKTRTDLRRSRDGRNRTTVRLVWTESGRQFRHDFCEKEDKVEKALDLIEFC